VTIGNQRDERPGPDRRPDPGIRFVLVGDDDGLPRYPSRDVAGFFDQPPRETPARHEIWLLGTDPPAGPGPSARWIGNAELQILDPAGTPIGGYYLGGAEALRYRPHADDPGSVDVLVTGVFFALPRPLAGSVWRRWQLGRPTRRNEWAGYPPAGREAWLEVTRIHFAYRDPVPDAPAGAAFELDGTHVSDAASLYCALGEAVNGPGGYFGAGLDGLRDCLAGGFGARPPFRLTWYSADVARTGLGWAPGGSGGATYFDAVLHVLTEAGVDVVAR
jgi:hypothetical protein